MKLVRRNDGFTLVEVIVVAGIIAVLAGILVPLIFKEIDESKKSRAQADVKSVSSAMMVLKKDTGQWPVSDSCVTGVTMHRGSGTVPTLGAGWDASSTARFDQFLASDGSACWPTTWKGPYMATVTADPWGHTYLLNTVAFLNLSGASPTEPVWLLSAGPNGVVDTAVNDTVLMADDIGVRIQ